MARQRRNPMLSRQKREALAREFGAGLHADATVDELLAYMRSIESSGRIAYDDDLEDDPTTPKPDLEDLWDELWTNYGDDTQYGEPNPRDSSWVVVAPANRHLWPTTPLRTMTRDDAIDRMRSGESRGEIVVRGGFASEGQARSYADKVENAIIEVARPDGTVVYRGSLLGFSDDPATSSLKFVDRGRVLELADMQVETKLGQGRKALVARRERGGNPYLGDAVEIAKQRKYEEARRRWEREGRRGPPPAPPRSSARQRNPREGSLVRRIGGR